MLEQARRRLGAYGLASARVEFRQADVLCWSAHPGTYDFVATHFFFDCFRSEQLERIISQLAERTTPDANWLIADFQAPPVGWKRVRSRLILWAMYAFFRTVTRLPARELTAPDAALLRAGFTLHCRTESEWGLLRSDWWKRF